MKKYDEVKKVIYDPKSDDPFTFSYYNPEEVILGKKMKDHLKFAISYWHTIDACGTDMFGGDTMDKNFGKDYGLERYNKKADFAFELMDKLQIEYYCFHDVDIAPVGKTLEESMKYFNEMVDYISELQKKHNKKLLWNTANNFGDKIFMAGAATSPNADVFACAAAKVKAGLDAAKKLNASGYVFWGGREGYETLLNTKVKFEQENIANLMRMARDYGRKIGFDGTFLIEPKPKEPMKHQYDYDAATAIGFLKEYGLDKDFMMNIEANHATLAGHTFQHELRISRINNMLGSIDANQGDVMLGWDTDCFPSNVYDTTLAMYEIVKNNGLPVGINFDSKNRRPSNTYEDMFHAFILGMDSFALGLIKAAAIIEDGRIEGFIDKKYESYKSELGQKIRRGETTLEELAEKASQMKNVKTPSSGAQEYLEGVLNNIILANNI